MKRPLAHGMRHGRVYAAMVGPDRVAHGSQDVAAALTFTSSLPGHGKMRYLIGRSLANQHSRVRTTCACPHASSRSNDAAWRNCHRA